MKYTIPGMKLTSPDTWWFTIEKRQKKLIVQQHPSRPKHSSAERDSVLMLTAPGAEPAALALNITWLSGKPAPETPDRQAGLIAVMEYIEQQLPAEQRSTHYAIGHAHGARVEANDD